MEFTDGRAVIKGQTRNYTFFNTTKYKAKVNLPEKNMRNATEAKEMAEEWANLLKKKNIYILK